MVRLATVFTSFVFFVFFVACSSSTDDAPQETNEDNATKPMPSSSSTGAKLPPASNAKSTTKEANDASASTSSTDGSTPIGDAGPSTMPDAAKGSDAAADATKTPTPTKLAFGQPCTSHAQCADGICLPFDGKGFRCTKACNSDSDCPSDDCNDDPRICDVD